MNKAEACFFVLAGAWCSFVVYACVDIVSTRNEVHRREEACIGAKGLPVRLQSGRVVCAFNADVMEMR